MESTDVQYISPSFDPITNTQTHQIPFFKDDGKTICKVEVALLNNSNGEFIVQQSTTGRLYLKTFYYASLPSYEELSVWSNNIGSWPSSEIPFNYIQTLSSENVMLHVPDISGSVFSTLIYPPSYASKLNISAKINLQKAVYGGTQPSVLSDTYIDYTHNGDNSTLTEIFASTLIPCPVHSGSLWLIGTKHELIFMIEMQNGTILKRTTSSTLKLHGRVRRTVQEALQENNDVQLSCLTWDHSFLDDTKQNFYTRYPLQPSPETTISHMVTLQALNWSDIAPPSTSTYTLMYRLMYITAVKKPNQEGGGGEGKEEENYSYETYEEFHPFGREMIVNENETDLKSSFPLHVLYNNKVYWFIQCQVLFVQKEADNYLPIFEKDSFLSQWCSIASVEDCISILNNHATLLEMNLSYSMETPINVDKPLLPSFENVIQKLFLQNLDQPIPQYNFILNLWPKYSDLEADSLKKTTATVEVIEGGGTQEETIVQILMKPKENTALKKVESLIWTSSISDQKWLVGAAFDAILTIPHNKGQLVVHANQLHISPKYFNMWLPFDLSPNISFVSSFERVNLKTSEPNAQSFDSYVREEKSNMQLTLTVQNRHVVPASSTFLYSGLKCLVYYRNQNETFQKIYEYNPGQQTVLFPAFVMPSVNNTTILWFEKVEMGY